MTDILTRLRDNTWRAPEEYAALLTEAATEIERLRTSYSATCTHVRGLDKAIEELRKDEQRHLDTIRDLRVRIDWLEMYGQQGA